MDDLPSTCVAMPAPGRARAGSSPSTHRAAQPVPPTSRGGPKLLERLREALRSRHYSRRTEEAYT